MPHSASRIALALISATGAGVFLFFLALTFHTPEWIEKFAKDFIEQEATKQIDARIDSLQAPGGESALERVAAALYRMNESEIERHRESLRLKVHEQVADAIAEARNLDCECRDKWARWLEQGTVQHIQLLENTGEKLKNFIQGTYAEVVTSLKRDIRIFTGANAVVFLLVLGISIAKPRAHLQLLVPGSLAVLAALICTYFYIFEQNWLLTIIYNDYLGFAYLGYLGLVFGLLCDIVLNRARITTEIVNAVLNAIGSAVSAVPC